MLNYQRVNQSKACLVDGFLGLGDHVTLSNQVVALQGLSLYTINTVLNWVDIHCARWVLAVLPTCHVALINKYGVRYPPCSHHSWSIIAIIPKIYSIPVQTVFRFDKERHADKTD